MQQQRFVGCLYLKHRCFFGAVVQQDPPANKSKEIVETVHTEQFVDWDSFFVL